MGTSRMSYPAHDVVDVWWSDLGRSSQQNADMMRSLAPDEIARAMTLPPAARCRFIRCRGLLRQILAAYTGMAATAIPIHHGPHGRAQLSIGTGLSFSLSHSGALAVFAVTSHGTVGIDAEHRTRPIDLLVFSARVCTQSEWDAIRHLPLEEQHRAAIRIWVRKEAVLKAAGVGLSCSPRDINVLSMSEQPIAFPSQRSTWRVIDVAMPDPGWIVAVAVSGNGATPSVQCREWQGAETTGDVSSVVC
jgi:4'-phosphopantetheinyl transferase